MVGIIALDLMASCRATVLASWEHPARTGPRQGGIATPIYFEQDTFIKTREIK
jgi:hypothetical protein